MARLTLVSLLEPVHQRRPLRARAGWLGWVAGVLALLVLVLVLALASR